MVPAESYSNKVEEVSGKAQIVKELETRIDSDRDAVVRVLRNWVEAAA